MGWSLCTWGVVVGMLLAFVSAAASQASTLRITQVYSNLDGTTQFIELTESAGQDGQHRVTGLTLTATGNNGVVKRYTFTRDLPTAQTAYMSFVIATRTMTVLGEIEPWWLTVDYVGEFPIHEPTIPERFVPIDGGTLEFAGIDRITYASLPTDGYFALFRHGRVTDVLVPARTMCMFAPPCAERYWIVPSDVHAVEYYHAGLDHYFMSASASEIDALDEGRSPGWRRTGERFRVNWNPGTPVCRFYLPPRRGNSHFFSASVDECGTVRSEFPDFLLETGMAFSVALPNLVTGVCGPNWLAYWENLIPVYRLWNARPDTSHRYTKQRKIRDQMLASGYVSEGYGPDGVAWCVPRSPGDP